MAEDGKNACCASWKEKHSKLLGKYSKLEELKNKFRNCTSIVSQQYDVIEKENGSLKQELGNFKAQADRWKDEKEQEYSMRVDLEGEISALKVEIQLLQQNGKAVSNESGRQLQERLDVAEMEINKLRELLEKERCRANLEKKNLDVERKKANEALKKLEAGKNKVSEAQKAVDIERKKAEENKILYERLRLETDAVKSKLSLERSKSEAANKKVEDEKQNTIQERKMADSSMFKAEEQRKLAETNLKKAIVEKARADDLNQKLKEEIRRTEKLEEELRECLCSRKLSENHIGPSNARIVTVLKNDVGTRTAKREALMIQGTEMVKEKDQFSFREKKRANSEVKKVVKHKKVAEAQQKKAVEEQCHVEQLSRELEHCKQRLEELQKRQQISGGTHVDNPAIRENNSSDRATVKLRKKQKKLEKMLVKHAKEVTKVDVRNNLLHQELFHVKKRFHQFQQRLDMIDFCFVHGSDVVHDLEKADNETFTKEKFYTDGYFKQLVSGIDSRLNPVYRGCYRKMSKSSALNSGTPSFSYLPLMGSQERGAFSVTTSAKPGEDVSNIKASLSKLSCKGTIRCGEKVAANAEKSTKSPIKGNADNGRIRHWDKRKILGAVESMDKLYSDGQKLHEQMSKQLSVLHDILSDHKDDSALQNHPENFCSELARPTKRRKTSCGGTKIIHSLHNSNRKKGILNSDINSNAGRKASLPGLNIRKCDQCLKDGIDYHSESTKCSHLQFDETPIHDYMKLLELDDPADERSYCIAVATPISPTLPEITFLGDEAIDPDDAGMPVKDNLAPTSVFNTFDMEKKCMHSENLDVEHASAACCYHDQVLGGKLRTPNVNGSKNEKTHLSRVSSIASIPGAIPNCFVFSLENKDYSSISRILQAISRCKPQCIPLHPADVFLQRILLSIEKAEDLSSKEKVSVLFSIIMLGISEIEMKNKANFFKCDLVQSLDSVTLHICSALSDLVVRGIFMESCDLFDLLALIEDFLLQRKVLVCGYLSSEAAVTGISKIKLLVNVNSSTVILSEQVAMVYQLVAGGCLLASLCLAVGHIGFVCETSCDLFAMPKYDHDVVLAILHSFAHFCGSQYITLQPYSLAMTAVKSLVMVLEKLASSSDYASSFSSVVEMPTKTWSCCANCLFSEGVVSMEVLASLLLENLQKYSKSCSLPQDSLELMNSFVPMVISNKEVAKEILGPRQAVSLTAISNESLCNFVDILSLVEIVAHFMRWEWTFDNIIGGLLEILESCAMESFCAATIVLLNRLGRLGVDSNGYEDAGIKKLRDCLFTFFCQSTSRNLSVPVQFATVTALLGLIPVSFEELFAIGSQSILSQESIPTDFIRKWFSLLSKEQQLSFRIHQINGKTKS